MCLHLNLLNCYFRFRDNIISHLSRKKNEKEKRWVEISIVNKVLILLQLTSRENYQFLNFWNTHCIAFELLEKYIFYQLKIIRMDMVIFYHMLHFILSINILITFLWKYFISCLTYNCDTVRDISIIQGIFYSKNTMNYLSIVNQICQLDVVR